MADEQPIQQKTLTKPNGNTFLSMEINRNAAKELEVKLISPISWHFLRVPGDEKTVTIAKVKCFRPVKGEIDGLSCKFASDNAYAFEYGENPNLILLLAADIKTGVTFNFGAFPISDEKIKNWVTKFSRDVKVLYHLYCKPVNIKVNFTTAMVEESPLE